MSSIGSVLHNLPVYKLSSGSNYKKIGPWVAFDGLQNWVKFEKKFGGRKGIH